MEEEESEEQNIRSIIWTEIGSHSVKDFSLNNLEIRELSTQQQSIALKLLNDNALPISYDALYYNSFLRHGIKTISQYWSRLAYFNDELIAGICCKIECDEFELNGEDEENNTPLLKKKKTRIDHFFAPLRKGVGESKRRLKPAAKMHLQTLACCKRFQRQGVASCLIDKLLRFCEESVSPSSAMPRIETVYLYVQAENRAAVALYEKFGFKVVERLSNYYRRIDLPNALRLELTLN